jgi:hypothetical protein
LWLKATAEEQKTQEEGVRRMSSVVKKVMFVGRATTFVVGLAVILALSVGLASTALAGTGVGARFDLGKVNTVNAITKLVGSVAGPSLQIDNNNAGTGATALDLQVEPGKAPMTVNSGAQVANLNADKVDGKSATEIGINGLERVQGASANDSSSHKLARATCPAGKVVVGTGYFAGGNSGSFPNQQTDVVVTQVFPSDTTVTVDAFEEEPTSANWAVTAVAICATAP